MKNRATMPHAVLTKPTPAPTVARLSAGLHGAARDIIVSIEKVFSWLKGWHAEKVAAVLVLSAFFFGGAAVEGGCHV